MLEIMLRPGYEEGGTGEGVYIDDLNLYFLESGKTLGGQDRSWVSIYYIELLNNKQNKIFLQDNQFIASSNYSASRTAIRVNTKTTSDWMSANNNNGNPNRTCWFRIANVNQIVGTIRIFWGHQCHYFTVEDSTSIIATVDVRDKSFPYYPYSPAQDAPLNDVSLATIEL